MGQQFKGMTLGTVFPYCIPNLPTSEAGKLIADLLLKGRYFQADHGFAVVPAGRYDCVSLWLTKDSYLRVKKRLDSI